MMIMMGLPQFFGMFTGGFLNASDMPMLPPGRMLDDVAAAGPGRVAGSSADLTGEIDGKDNHPKDGITLRSQWNIP